VFAVLYSGSGVPNRAFVFDDRDFLQCLLYHSPVLSVGVLSVGGLDLPRESCFADVVEAEESSLAGVVEMEESSFAGVVEMEE
jgi:hypothetical protein